MFNALSWNDFITAIIVCIAGYYSIIIVIFYRAEIARWIRTRRSGSKEAPESNTLFTDDTILGARQESNTIVLPSATTDSDAIQIVVDSTEEAEAAITPVKQKIQVSPTVTHAMLIGSVSDLMQEIRTIIELSEGYRSDRKASAALFSTALQKYPHLIDTSYQHAITDFICVESKGQFDFDLTPDDVAQWWNAQPLNS